MSDRWSAAASSRGSPTWWRCSSSWYGPRGWSAKNTSTGSDHALPRSRTVQVDLRAGPADLSDPAGPHRDGAAARVRLRDGAADRRPVLADAAHHAVPDLRARRARPEHPHRLRRTALARYR